MAKEEGGGEEAVAKEDAGAVQQCGPAAARLAEGGGCNVKVAESTDIFVMYLIYLIFDRWLEC